MPLNGEVARALRALERPFAEDELDQRYARALAWLGHRVELKLTTGQTVRGAVEGTAILPQVGGAAVANGVLLLRRGGPRVDVLEGYVLGTIVSIAEASEWAPKVESRDRRERFE